MISPELIIVEQVIRFFWSTLGENAYQLSKMNDVYFRKTFQFDDYFVDYAASSKMTFSVLQFSN